MATEINTKITESEWEIMRVVWTFNKVTSKEIIEVLQEKKAWKPATTKTFIGRLVKKGMLNTEPHGKRYLYSATVSEDETVKNVTNEFFDNICSKDVGKTIAEMISTSTLSFDDIALIEEVLEKKKKTAVEQVKCNCLKGQCQCKNNHNH
ncbi:CopY/TcrY family copper transport repressor [Salipaludibacillus keqinensis]|uniref:CopY/TcrY family copper transport repressor n=1 Tax=Salipaludibacillus keqinensis TaxID=2045207 RepID=A0A323THK3_9BACI|nr:CopY/TcrY family copper transport repressor [Salipaludibacillus keqinensis]PYZ93017.1 CopY/TcrY family copper transport repressor [Salipaludibacillus keqinensis]